MKPPPMIADLYRDLRDKRLLPVVALLVVGLIAVPILLGGEAEAPPASTAAPSAAVAAAAEAPELDPVVLADVPGIRNFEKRLSEFRKRNPFQQQLTGPPPGLEGLGELQDSIQSAADAAASASGDSGSATGASSSSSSSTSPTPSSDSGSSGSGGSSGSSGSGGSSGSTGGRTEPELHLFTWTIDAKVGQVGDAEKKEGVKQLEFLPGRRRPVVQFIQGNLAATEAIFVVSGRVEKTSGEGRCDPTPDRCEFLLLEEGDEHRFSYGPDGNTYRLKLAAVDLHEERISESDLGAAKKRFERSSGYADLRGGITE